MANQKISELSAIVTIDNSADVLPIVDSSANTTKKVTPTQLKTTLALDNVNNTSDANKPVSTAQQDALNGKVTANAAITAGTAPKVTFDAKGLVTSGDSLDETDLPTGINANKIGTGVVSTTEFEYLNGVTSAIQTQIDAKQATLVSGTNIKTLNSLSLLGSGDIVLTASPSGVAGAIQFSNVSAFASDAANLFWDDTNNRLGVGTNAPTAILQSQNATNGVLLARFKDAVDSTSYIDIKNDASLTEYTGLYFGTDRRIMSKQGGALFLTCSDNINFVDGLASKMTITPSEVQIGSISGARLGIKGSGSTSATTSLLVQNSAGTQLFKVADDGRADFGGTLFGVNGVFSANLNFQSILYGTNFWSQVDGGTTIGAQAAPVASAILDIRSTTRGFLPPRGTNTQMNAIASPATGLVFYDTTNNKLCVYNATSWIPLH